MSQGIALGAIPGWDFVPDYTPPIIDDKPLAPLQPERQASKYGPTWRPTSEPLKILLETRGISSQGWNLTISDNQLAELISWETRRNSTDREVLAQLFPTIELTAAEISSELISELQRLGYLDEAAKLYSCGKQCLCMRNRATQEAKGVPVACDRRLCWYCARRRQALEQRRYVPVIEAMRNPMFATFTQRARIEEDLESSTDRLWRALELLRKDVGWQKHVSGGFGTCETLPKPHHWHTHYHGAIDGGYVNMCNRLESDVEKPGYYWSDKAKCYLECDRLYVPRLRKHAFELEELLDLWRSARRGHRYDLAKQLLAEYHERWTLQGAWYLATERAGLEFFGETGWGAYHLRWKHIKDPEASAREILKYLTKVQAIRGDKLGEFVDYFNAKKRRTLRSFGWCHGFKPPEEEEITEEYEIFGTIGGILGRIKDKLVRRAETALSDWAAIFEKDALDSAQLIVEVIRNAMKHGVPDVPRDLSAVDDDQLYEREGGGWDYHFLKVRREASAAWPDWLWRESGAERLFGPKYST